MINSTTAIAALFGLVLTSTPSRSCAGWLPATPSSPLAQVHTSANGVQKATIVVDNGFAPSSLTVKAGKPVELTFDTKNRACATAVVFPRLNLKKDLTNGKKTVVRFTPKKPGAYAFSCQMKMLSGTIIVK